MHIVVLSEVHEWVCMGIRIVQTTHCCVCQIMYLFRGPDLPVCVHFWLMKVTAAIYTVLQSVELL